MEINIFQRSLIFIDLIFITFVEIVVEVLRVPSLLMWYTERRLLCVYLMGSEDRRSLNTCTRVPSNNNRKR